MSKFVCKCGEIIRDQKDNLPYKGYLFSDTELFGLFDKISKDIAEFIQARIAGKQTEWISDYFGKIYPCTNDEAVVHDIVSAHLISADLDLYQCYKCGRLYVEHRDNSSRLEIFFPEKSPYRDIFKK